jgi:hypothetical protein
MIWFWSRWLVLHNPVSNEVSFCFFLLLQTRDDLHCRCGPIVKLRPIHHLFANFVFRLVLYCSFLRRNISSIVDCLDVQQFSVDCVLCAYLQKSSSYHFWKVPLIELVNLFKNLFFPNFFVIQIQVRNFLNLEHDQIAGVEQMTDFFVSRVLIKLLN